MTGWMGDPKRGAAFGLAHELGAPRGRRTLRRVPINSGGYDRARNYWGLGLPLYELNKGDGELYRFRAANRAEALHRAAAM